MPHERHHRLRFRHRRDLPLILPMVEVFRRLHVVSGKQRRLDPVEIIGIADVASEVRRHAVDRLEDARNTLAQVRIIGSAGALTKAVSEPSYASMTSLTLFRM